MQSQCFPALCVWQAEIFPDTPRSTVNYLGEVPVYNVSVWVLVALDRGEGPAGLRRGRKGRGRRGRRGRARGRHAYQHNDGHQAQHHCVPEKPPGTAQLKPSRFQFHRVLS